MYDGTFLNQCKKDSQFQLPNSKVGNDYLNREPVDVYQLKNKTLGDTCTSQGVPSPHSDVCVNSPGSASQGSHPPSHYAASPSMHSTSAGSPAGSDMSSHYHGNSPPDKDSIMNMLSPLMGNPMLQYFPSPERPSEVSHVTSEVTLVTKKWTFSRKVFIISTFHENLV